MDEKKKREYIIKIVRDPEFRMIRTKEFNSLNSQLAERYTQILNISPIQSILYKKDEYGNTESEIKYSEKTTKLLEKIKGENEEMLRSLFPDLYYIMDNPDEVKNLTNYEQTENFKRN